MQKYAVLDYEKQAVIHGGHGLLVQLMSADSARKRHLQETI